ncbi:hypothetical protein C8R44DRAFT_612967 [Mycena epipterygia]|nr:hypothetical protein C8R44DRAFT_612967 [Mycena epipterygia]
MSALQNVSHLVHSAVHFITSLGRRCITVARTVEKTALFGDQKPAPPLGNLATHLRIEHKGEPAPSHVHPGEIRGIGTASSKIMEDFLIEGKLNPVINSTQSNFLKIFAAWIVEDDLAFTTGETVGINRLFQFLHTRYQLPSDTTVRNTLAEILIYLIAATLDNAAPNDVLIRALSRLLREKFDVQFVPENSQIRCLAHVVNLVVQKMLAALEEAPDHAVED